MQARQDGGLLQVVHAVGHDAGRDHDQERAGPSEEAAQVETQRAAVDEHAEHDRDDQPEQGAEQRCGRVAGRPGGGPEEQGGLEALTADGEQRQDRQADAAGGGDVDLGLELALDVAGLAGHPEDHPGHEHDGDDRQGAADGLLRLEGETPWPEGEQRAEPDGDDDGDGDAQPDARQQLAAIGLDQVGHEDADDQRGLEAFTQSDQEVREHGAALQP